MRHPGELAVAVAAAFRDARKDNGGTLALDHLGLTTAPTSDGVRLIPAVQKPQANAVNRTSRSTPS